MYTPPFKLLTPEEISSVSTKLNDKLLEFLMINKEYIYTPYF